MRTKEQIISTYFLNHGKKLRAFTFANADNNLSTIWTLIFSLLQLYPRRLKFSAQASSQLNKILTNFSFSNLFSFPFFLLKSEESF